LKELKELSGYAASSREWRMISYGDLKCIWYCQHKSFECILYFHKNYHENCVRDYFP